MMNKSNSILKNSLQLFLALICFAIATQPLAAPKTETKHTLIKKLDKQIKNLKHSLKEAHLRRTSTLSQLKKTELSISKLEGQLNKSKKALDVQGKILSKLVIKQDGLNTKIGKQQIVLAAQVREAYFLGKHQYLKLVLNQKNPHQINRLLAYYKNLNYARMDFIFGLRKNITDLESNKKQIKIQSKKLHAIAMQQQIDQNRLNKQKSNQNSLVVTLDSEIKSNDQYLKQLLSDKNALEHVVRRLKQKEFGTNFNLARGKLMWPTTGKVTQHFGSSLGQSGLKSNGVFIRTTEGSDVKAVHPGRVVFANWLRGYGLLTIVEHGDGYMTLYGHNRSLYKQLGDPVESGEIIASVGHSGGNKTSGLYFEIRHDGLPTNPEHWCT